jgi:hypothetical protein
MDVNAPQWDDYEAAFNALADEALPWQAEGKPDLTTVAHYLCLYGDNGLDPAAEFELLNQLKPYCEQGRLYCLEVEADYWFERILFVL